MEIVNPEQCDWSVEPLCPTHNVQRRREPVYNSGNPRRKNKDCYFPAGNLLFQVCSNLLQSFCQSRSVECFPSSHGYVHFPPNPSYYSLVCNMEKPRWMSARNHYKLFRPLFFYLLSHPFNSVWARKADWWQELLKSAVFAVWSDGSVISPADRTHAEARGGQRHSICLRTIKSRCGEGTGDQKLKVSYFLSCWSSCSSDPKVIGLIPDFCLLHV